MEVMPLKVTSKPTFYPVTSNLSKMAHVKISGVDTNLHQSTWNHGILYADRASEDEQLSIRSLLRKNKNTNMADG
jgi:hypothetical protein